MSLRFHGNGDFTGVTILRPRRAIPIVGTTMAG